MKRFLTEPPCVLLLISTSLKASRDILSGILGYVKMHSPWNLHIIDNADLPSSFANVKSRAADGMIIGLVPKQSNHIDFGIPIVTLDGNPGQLASHFVNPHEMVCDARAIAEAAADHLIARGFTHFAYVGDLAGRVWAEDRGMHFQARLRERGFDCPVLVPERYPQSDPHLRWTDYQRLATDWLQALPPQTAVFAANDRRAMTILDICRIAGIRVPGDLAILGCDNDEILCENTTPPLSSVEPDFQTAGYQAAQTLDRLMAGAGADAVPVRQHYGVKRIVERVSTLYRPNALSPRTLAALDFIRLNAANEIGVADVAAHIRISRRSAELLFRRDLDQTIGHAIQAARVERMKTLLADTMQSATAICGLSGYASESQAKLAFKRHVGMAMSEYRKTRLTEKTFRTL